MGLARNLSFVLFIAIPFLLGGCDPEPEIVVLEIDSRDDKSDETPGDGVCAADNGNCTLRAAIEEIVAPPISSGQRIRGCSDGLRYRIKLAGGEEYKLDNDKESEPIQIQGAMRRLGREHGLQIIGDCQISVAGATTGAANDREARKAHIRRDDGRGRLFTVWGAELGLLNIRLSNGDQVYDDDEIDRGALGYGGAIAVDTSGALKISDCIFENNRADSRGGAIYMVNQRGALWLEDYALDDPRRDRHSIIQSSVFRNNRSGSQGGAVMVDGKNLEIEDVAFRNNDAGNSGGAVTIRALRQPVTLARVMFNENWSELGGAVLISNQLSHDIRFENATFVGNEAVRHATADGIRSNGFGGAIAIVGPHPVGGPLIDIVHSTIVRNYSHNGFAISATTNSVQIPLRLHGTVVAYNYLGSLFRDDPDGEHVPGAFPLPLSNCSGDLKLRDYNFLQEASGTLNCNIRETGTGNIPSEEEPLLFGPNAQSIPVTNVTELIPVEGSILLEAAGERCAHTPVDDRGIVRPRGSACDIGAFER